MLPSTLHHMTYAPAKLEVAASNSLGDAFIKKSKKSLFYIDLGVKAPQDTAQHPQHHVTYAPTKFEAVMLNGLGECEFTRKCII